MPAFVYILYSPSKDRYYIGATDNLRDRMKRHLGGYSKSTSPGRPWIVSYLQPFSSFAEARSFEDYLKKQKRRSAYLPLINSYLCNPYPIPDYTTV